MAMLDYGFISRVTLGAVGALRRSVFFKWTWLGRRLLLRVPFQLLG